MNRVWRYVKNEWEKVACGAAAMALSVFLLTWGLAGQRSLEPPRAGKLPPPDVAVNEAAFAYLAPRSTQEELSRNPFRFEFQTRPARPKRVPGPPAADPAPEPEPAPRPEPVQEDGDDSVETAERPAGAGDRQQPARPRVRLVAGHVKFVFYNINQSGKPVALIELRNPARPGATPLARSLSVGDTLLGVRILNVSERMLTVADATGRRHRVALGDEQRLAIRLVPGQ